MPDQEWKVNFQTAVLIHRKKKKKKSNRVNKKVPPNISIECRGAKWVGEWNCL